MRRALNTNNTVTQILGKLTAKPFLTKRIFDILCDHPYGLTSRELVPLLYADRQDGGPITAERMISVRTCLFNKLARRERLGLRIHCLPRTGAGARYLIWLVRE